MVQTYRKTFSRSWIPSFKTGALVYDKHRAKVRINFTCNQKITIKSPSENSKVTNKVTKDFTKPSHDLSLAIP